MGRPPVSLGFVHLRVTDLLSKSTILGSPGGPGGPAELYFLKNPEFCFFKKKLTVRILCEDGVAREHRLRLALLVDGRDLKLVQMSRLEAFGCSVASSGLRCIRLY